MNEEQGQSQPQGGNVKKDTPNIPTGFFIEKCNITLHVGDKKPKDIRDLITHFNIKEDLGSNQVEVRLAIGDTVNFIGNAQLSGDEKIELVVSKSLPDEISALDFVTDKIKLNLRILEIEGFTRLKPGMVTYVLNCVSEYVYESNKKILTDSFNGSIGTLIKNIATADLKLKDDQLDIQTEGVNIVKGIYPYTKPLQSMRWLKGYSDHSNSPLFLYQTADGVLRFKSLDKMIEEFKGEKIEYFTYSYRPSIQVEEKKESPYTYHEERQYITALGSTGGYSKFVAEMEGAMASNTITVDIGKKNVIPLTEQHNKESSIETVKTFADEEKYIENYNSRIYYISKNSTAYLNEQPDDENTTTGDKNLMEGLNRSKTLSKLAMLKSHQQSIKVPGDFSIKVGQLLQLNIHNSYEQELDAAPLDNFTSGKYLITNITHDFNKQYTQVITLVRDGHPKVEPNGLVTEKVNG